MEFINSLFVEFIIRDKVIPFTNFNLALFALCYFKPYSNYINYDYLYSISYCWSHLIFITFNGAYFIDNSSFRRITIRKKISLPVFHIGNMILHNLPVIYVNIYIPRSITLVHSLIACLTNLVWCYFATYGTFDIKHVYVYMKKKDQVKLYILNICSIFYVPLIFQSNNIIRNVLL